MNRVSSIFSYMLKLVSATPFERAPRLRLPKRMLSLDSNVFGLCAKVFDWAKYLKTKGTVRLHLPHDHEDLLPHFAVVTEGNRCE